MSPTIEVGQVLQAAKTVDSAFALFRGRLIACALRTGDILTPRGRRIRSFRSSIGHRYGDARNQEFKWVES
jgi:hypothetical protein